jgi:hypothetical protein
MDSLELFNLRYDFNLTFQIQTKAVTVFAKSLEGIDAYSGVAVIDPDGMLRLIVPDSPEVVFKASNSIVDIALNQS